MTMTIEAPMDEQAPLPVAEYSTPGNQGTPSRPDYVMPDLCAEPPAYRRIWLGMAFVIIALYGILIFRFWDRLMMVWIKMPT